MTRIRKMKSGVTFVEERVEKEQIKIIINTWLALNLESRRYLVDLALKYFLASGLCDPAKTKEKISKVIKRLETPVNNENRGKIE